MKKDNLYTTEEARAKLRSGIKKIADAVGSTMGTRGSNAIIEAMETPGHLMTNDGFSIANAIELGDPIEEMGRKILVESINRANKASGDGSSTTCVLTAAIIEEGVKAGGDAMTLKRSLEECIPLIEESIKVQTREIDVEDKTLEQVATVSSEDEYIGKTIAEIYAQIGKKGIIHWDVSKTAFDSFTVGQGITIEGAGWFSPYMCDASDAGMSTNQVRIKNPRILVMKQKLSSAADLGVIAGSLDSDGVKDLIVFADDIDPLVIPDIIKTRMVRGFRIVIVKMPVLWKDQWFEDLALATGARVIDPAAGLPLKQATPKDLGTCSDIVITKDDTFLDGIKDVSEHIAQLEAEGDDAAKLRASRLNTKTARYFVGAHSDSALSYRRLKVEDAISAAYQALNGGVVPGGGSALIQASQVMGNTVGQQVLREALSYPARTIAANAGKPNWTTVELTQYLSGRGLDTKDGGYKDMFEAGIIDPAIIVLNAVKNAVSVAAAVLTANTVVTFSREEEPATQPNVVLR